jgi:hypothetical protein
MAMMAFMKKFNNSEAPKFGQFSIQNFSFQPISGFGFGRRSSLHFLMTSEVFSAMGADMLPILIRKKPLVNPMSVTNSSSRKQNWTQALFSALENNHAFVIR